MTSLVDAIRYPEDFTGTNPNNLVQWEEHDLSTISKNVKVIIPKYGPYFADSLVMLDNVTNTPLFRLADFKCTEPAESLYDKAGGQDVCTAIAITRANVSSVRLQYQTVGGNYVRNAEATQSLINALEIDNRPVFWRDVTDRWDTYPPGGHFHNAQTDIYNTQFICYWLEQIAQAISLGDAYRFDRIYRYIDQQIANQTGAGQLTRVALNPGMTRFLLAM